MDTWNPILESRGELPPLDWPAEFTARPAPAEPDWRDVPHEHRMAIIALDARYWLHKLPR